MDLCKIRCVFVEQLLGDEGNPGVKDFAQTGD